MIIDSNFAIRLRGFLKIYNKSACSTAFKALSFSEWGMKEDMEKNLEKLEDFALLSLYLTMLEWKSYEQNTFFLENNEDSGCPIITYPSIAAAMVEEDLNNLQATNNCLPCDEKTKEYPTLVECLCRYFDCKHGMNIEPLLRLMGVVPVGEVPDGISYMVIKEGNDDCDDNIFEVNKQ